MTAYIYKIEPIIEHDEGDVYYGYTRRKKISARYSKHRYQFLHNEKKQTTAKILFNKYGVDNCYYFLVEEVNLIDVKERENFYILNNKCVNRYINNKYGLENYNKIYNAENKEKIKEQRKKYYEVNKEKLLAQQKEYREKQKLNPPPL
jgi:hypothetical protein